MNWSRLLAAAVAFGRLTGEVAVLTAEHLGRDVFAAAHEVNDQQTIVLHQEVGHYVVGSTPHGLNVGKSLSNHR